MASKSTPHYEGEKSLIDFKPQVGKTMEIYPKDLNIVWGGDNRYWNVSKENGKPAELYQVSWLEVTVSVAKTDPNKEYEVGFLISFTPDAFGWCNSPTFIMVKRGKMGKFAWEKQILDSNKIGYFEFKKKLKNSEGTKQDDSESRNLYFGLYEVWSGKWKGGLKIDHAFVREV